MSKMFHKLLILSFFIVSCNAYAFDFYKLALQWPPTFCMDPKKPCNPTSIHDTTFRVHGLWPSNDTGVQPRSCTAPGNIAPVAMIPRGNIPGYLKTDLDLCWPNLYLNEDNYKFWKDEWDFHGTCSHHEKDPMAYLNLVNNCRKKVIDLDRILRAAKVIPDNTTPYGVTLINNTIFNSHAIPELYCKPDKITNELYLLEIRLCFSNNDANRPDLIHCKATNNCGTEFKLPK